MAEILSPRTQRIFRFLGFRGRRFLEGFHDLVDRAFQLRIAAFGHERWVIDYRNIRIHAVAFDDPLAFGAIDAEAGNSYISAIHQRRRARDADEATRGASANNWAEARLL